MRFSTLVMMGLLAGCAGGEGVDLEVTSEVAIDRIELFIATKDCYDGPCSDGIGWTRDGQQMRPPGDIFYVQFDEEPVFSTTTMGSAIVLHLQAESSYSDPKLITIVGFKDDVPVAFNTLWYTRIPQHTAEHWKVELKPADRIEADPTGPSPTEKWLRIDTWRGVAGPMTRCLAMQSWDEHERKWKGTYVVPESDPDCDGYTDLECNERVADFEGATSCLIGTTASCRIGVDVCRDGVARDANCIAPNLATVCLPSRICERCLDAGSLEECAASEIKEPVNVNDSVIHGSCHLYPTTTTLEPCSMNGDRTFIKLPTACSAVDLLKVGERLDMLPDGTRKAVTVGGATVTIADFSSSATPECTINFVWTMGAVVATQYAETVILAIHNGAKIMLLPLELNFPVAIQCTASVAVPEECVKTGGIESDSVWQCSAM